MLQREYQFLKTGEHLRGYDEQEVHFYARQCALVPCKKKKGVLLFSSTITVEVENIQAKFLNVPHQSVQWIWHHKFSNGQCANMPNKPHRWKHNRSKKHHRPIQESVHLFNGIFLLVYCTCSKLMIPFQAGVARKSPSVWGKSSESYYPKAYLPPPTTWRSPRS